MKRRVRLGFTVWALLASPVAGQDCDLTGLRLFIDPGHGGSDPGAIGPTGLLEKDVTLDVSLKLRDWLWWFGAEVGMSRTVDVFVPLATRANEANAFGARRFSSIHMNGFSDPSANGTETYVVPNPPPITRDFGQKTQNSLIQYLGLRDRGLKFANFTVLVRTTMPAALSESAFITNPIEESYLGDENVRWWIAEAHAYAICASLYEYGELGVAQTAPTPPEPQRVEFRRLSANLGRLEVIGTIGSTRGLTGARFSPDGNRIAFSERGYNGLYVADRSVFQTQQVSHEPGVGFGFSWSPDGRMIAFRSQERTTFAVRTVRLSTRAVETIAESARPIRPVFKSDGTLHIVDEAGASGPVAPSPSVFIKDDQVWVEREGTAEQLTDDGLVYSDPKLSPRNDLVIVTGNSKSGSALFVIDLSTRQPYDLSALGSGRAGGLNLGHDATWSPDGRHVLFSVTGDDGYKYLASDLYVVDPDGTNLIRLTDDGSVKVNVDWSARDELAFEDAEGHIVIAKINTSVR